MHPLLKPVDWIYRAVRRLNIIDVTRLMHLPAGECSQADQHEGYEIRTVSASELRELFEVDAAPESIGHADDLSDGHRALLVAIFERRVVSYIWFARQHVQAADNFSRAEHLGTSIDLPDGTAFVYNAWTDPRHRGGRLVARLLAYAVQHRVMGAWSLLTSIDWTNSKSIRAFQFIGMRPLGTVVRIGRGTVQISMIPAAASRLGVQVASDAPGWKVAI